MVKLEWEFVNRITENLSQFAKMALPRLSVTADESLYFP